MAKVLSDSNGWWTSTLPGIKNTQKWVIIKNRGGNTFFLQGIDPDFGAVYWVKSSIKAKSFDTRQKAEDYIKANLKNYGWDDIINIKR